MDTFYRMIRHLHHPALLNKQHTACHFGRLVLSLENKGFAGSKKLKFFSPFGTLVAIYIRIEGGVFSGFRSRPDHKKTIPLTDGWHGASHLKAAH